MDFVYLYGMIMSTESFLLKGSFPAPDGYAEIKEKHHHIGGETGTAAAVLASLGLEVRLGGSHLGNGNRELIRNYFRENRVDLSELKDEDFSGIVDYVLIDSETRTCFGEWEKHFGREKPFYEPPCEESVKKAVCCGMDPFFCAEESAALCRKYNKPFATIDCAYDSVMNRSCAINAVSHQYLESYYPDQSLEELFRLYTDQTEGLVIFTRGEKPLMYGRKGQPPKYFSPYRLNIVSTLGAGDSFKAGTVYALSRKMSDLDTVKYACAIAGTACTRFPISKSPPTLSEVEKLTESEDRKNDKGLY